jgi:hypothetical protein
MAASTPTAARKAWARRLAIGVAGAVSVQLAAWFALVSPFGLEAQIGPLRTADVATPVIDVDLVTSSAWAGAVERSPDGAAPSRVAPLEETSAATASPSPPGASEPGPAASSSDDALFRVAFRDAVGQASSELRAGLSCAHVDLSQLPRSVRDRCAGIGGRLVQ